MTDKQTVTLKVLLSYNLQSVRARLSREEFHRFWQYSSPRWNGRFPEEWTARTMRSFLEPMKYEGGGPQSARTSAVAVEIASAMR